jgi:hypothetical protein
VEGSERQRLLSFRSCPSSLLLLLLLLLLLYCPCSRSHSSIFRNSYLLTSTEQSNPAIVLEDADLDSTVEGVLQGLTLLNGQWCCGLGRLVVHEGTFLSSSSLLPLSFLTFPLHQPFGPLSVPK